MRNLNYISCIEIDEFDLIGQSKHLITRNILNTLKLNVTIDYNNYVNQFSSIHTIVQSNYNSTDSAALLSCYTVKTKARDLLVKKIIDAQTDEFKAICPYCLYHTASTIDHYIPKDEYPVFSVLPKNLLPCCSTCNGIKGELWRKNKQRVFIHFYNDLILNSTFLNCVLNFVSSIPTITYSLTQPSTLSLAQHNIIVNHFSKLELLDLYKKGVPSIISEIKVDVDAIKNGGGFQLTPTSIRNILLRKSSTLKNLYGINYWRALALDVLCNSQQFLKSL